ncbi:HK97 family phage prohead protease [Defluviimonas sp. WL0002]|uniref:HK97 family phage prohead protease n=1 Tax=Albidovulum marisflavi TaxID=2984159 RepID=A0ABT2ZHQ4_9RHOB|nr:prohead protease/major capsid protein fusion protein [Defluviimonas sp. WL0002]MCV2870641.1 HK97 family phage prohead protease [Defluviimonas sp. WL0002]
MPKDLTQLPLIGRRADVLPDTIDADAREIDIIWTTGATVQRYRWEGWDDIVEYDEELIVSEAAVRLDRLNAGAPFLDSHMSYSLESVIGSVVPGSVRIENGQGSARIKLTSAPDAADIVHRILEKTVRHVSVGYRVHKYEITKASGERELWRAVDWEPYEISAVAMPADAGAQIRSAKEVAPGMALSPCVLIRQDQTAAAAASLKGTTMTDKTKAAVGAETDPTTAQTETRTAPTQQPAPQPADSTKAVSAERERGLAITKLVRQHGLDQDFGDKLIEEGKTLDQARAAILDALVERSPKAGQSEIAPAQARGDGAREAGYRDAVSEAILHRSRPNVNKLTDAGREFRGMSLIDMARDALERRGVSTRGMSKLELAGAAFQMRSAGMHSTSDFPNILANVANKSMRSAYESAPKTFTAWARRATIADFKPVSRNKLGGAPDLLKVNESGEFKYGTMGEKKETYSLVTYGRIMALTRQTIVNDDLDAFTRIPEAFGAAAADLESDTVYAILTGNPAMSDGTALFHANHGNLLTGATISETSLAAAYRAFGSQKGIEARPIKVMPQYIIVPPGARSVEARKQVTATTPASTADVNTFANRLQVVEEPRLIPAAGNDPWFLAADPNRIDTVEYAYLDGQDGVFTETRMGFDVDGMEIKARHDFAAAAIDWLGMSKNPGA